MTLKPIFSIKTFNFITLRISENRVGSRRRSVWTAPGGGKRVLSLIGCSNADFGFTPQVEHGRPGHFSRIDSSSASSALSIRVLAVIQGLFLLIFWLNATAVFGQGGPPYYTNDPGTPGNLDWEINLGYMPFLFSDQSVSHTPDVDINFGIGDRIQLTYENAWLRVHDPSSKTRFGLGQSNPGVKWRFLDGGESGLNISVFPQLFLNNPNDAVRRGITSASESFLLPLEFSRKIGPIDVDYEAGYLFVHKGPNGWLNGLVLGHDLTPKLEMDVELYNQGTFHPSANQPTIDFGARYKIRPPVILLLMAGRSLESSRSNQTFFLGYFGIQFLLPPSHKSDLPPPEERH
jgi:hypothetical protein